MDPSVRRTAILVLALLFCALRVEGREGRFFAKIFGIHHSQSAASVPSSSPSPAPAPAPEEGLFVRAGNGYGLYGRDGDSNEIESAHQTTATPATGATALDQNRNEGYTTVYEKYRTRGSTDKYTRNEFENTRPYRANTVGLDNEEEEEADDDEEEEKEEEKLRKAGYQVNNNEEEFSSSRNNYKGYSGRQDFNNNYNGNRYTLKSGLPRTVALGTREGSVDANSQTQRYQNNNQQYEFDSLDQYDRLQGNYREKSSATSYPNALKHSNYEGYSNQQVNNHYNEHSTRNFGVNDEGSYHGGAAKSQYEFDSMDEYDRLMGNYNPNQEEQP